VTDMVQVVSIAVSITLLAVVIELVRRRLLVEEYSLIWLVGAASLLLLACFRQILHVVARWLNVFYPPSLLLLVILFFAFVGLMFFSVVVSTQRAQIRRLFEETALLAAQLRALEAELKKTQPGP